MVSGEGAKEIGGKMEEFGGRGREAPRLKDEINVSPLV